jgi:uncharacterized protein with HEPN domain
MSPADAVRLRHMTDAAEAALRFARGRERADVGSDEMLRFALVRAVEIIGEAAAGVSHEGRAEAAEIDWEVGNG